MLGRQTALCASVVLLLCATAGCFGQAPEPAQREKDAPPSSTSWRKPDPSPAADGDPMGVDSDGGDVSLHDVDLIIAPGTSTAPLEVTVGKPIGAYGTEYFARPVHVEHDTDLAKPVTVSWPIGDLTKDQARAAMLVHYNEKLKRWETAEGAVRVEGDRIVAEVRHFSWADIVTDLGQGLGEVTGSRVDAPQCSGALPLWVQGTVDPDQDTGAAAIRVCFERDKGETVTVRVADNRTFSQRLVMREGGQEWAWTWPGKTEYGVPAAVYNAARTVFDTKTSYLVPPLKEVALGIGRPVPPGAHFIRVEAQVDGRTAMVDLTNWLAGKVSPGGLQNPLANTFFQALYECGGKQLLDVPNTDAASVVRAAVEAIGSCAAEIVEYDSEFGARFEQLAQRQIRAHPGRNAEDWAKANRLVHEVAHAFAILEYGKVAFYLSDQFASAMVGNLSFSIRGRGRPQELGAWEPDCADAAVDAQRLYVNLALRDEFSDTSRELWQFPGWAGAAQEAVQPLAACDPVYLTHLVDALPTVWDDTEAAQVVADAVAALYGADGGTAQVIITPFTDTGLRPGWRIDRSFGDSPPLDCSFDDGSPHAVGGSTHYCGGTADAANACWSSQFSTAELWCIDTFHPGRRTLFARPATGVNDDTAAPTDPAPLFLQLSDGSRWWFRIGGAWGGRADGAAGAYGCANDVGVCGAPTPDGTDGNIILHVNGEPVVDKSAPVWTVQVGLLGNPSTDYPPPVTMQVTRAWFIAGHRWSGD